MRTFFIMTWSRWGLGVIVNIGACPSVDIYLGLFVFGIDYDAD